MGDTKEKTLDDVIKVCEEKYGLGVTKQNKNKYIRFLERQLNAHSNYDLNKRNLLVGVKSRSYPYFKLMINKLMLFSYLIGETPIIAGYEGHTEEKRIESVDDLYLLRHTELGAGEFKINRTDKNLYSLYVSFGRYNRRYLMFSFPNWSTAIDELGQDEEVVRYFNQQITSMMVQRCSSPNPYTLMHGRGRAKMKS